MTIRSHQAMIESAIEVAEGYLAEAKLALKARDDVDLLMALAQTQNMVRSAHDYASDGFPH